MSQSESSSQSEKDDQNNDDGSDEDEGEGDDNSDNDDSNDNENQNSEERKRVKGRRRKLKRKKISRYFNDENAKVEIKTDRTIKGVHKYKVAITIGEKTITRWFSDKVILEKASDALEIYNTRPKKIKKKKIRRSIHKQQRHANDPVDENDEQNVTYNENESKALAPQDQNETFNDNQSILLTAKPEKKQKQHKSNHSEEINYQTADQVQNQNLNSKPETVRQIKKVFGIKNRENANFPDFVVQFTDSNRIERISWKKMHKLYKNDILKFYEKYVDAFNLRLMNELPEGLQLEENLYFMPYS